MDPMDIDADESFLCDESIDPLPQALESSGEDKLTEGLDKSNIDAFWSQAWPYLEKYGWEKVRIQLSIQ